MKKIPFKALAVISIVLAIVIFSNNFANAGNSSIGADAGTKSTTGTDAPVKSTIGSDAPVVNSGIFTLSNPLKVDSIGALVQALVEIFTYIAILFAVIMFIYVGFQYIYNASKGNTSEITKLHGQLRWLIVGVAIVIAARVIVQVVINTLQATNVVSPGVIESANKAIRGN